MFSMMLLGMLTGLHQKRFRIIISCVLNSPSKLLLFELVVQILVIGGDLGLLFELMIQMPSLLYQSLIVLLQY